MVLVAWTLPARVAAAGRQLVPPPAAGLGRPVQPRPRRQRRAEDDRHHLDAADRRRATSARATTLPPAWVIWSCYIAIGLGTLFGGWRIVKTMGQQITKLKPVGGFCAETGGAITLFLATALGIPVSTTHTITGAIVGVGSVRRAVGGALGRGRQHRLGLDLHDPGVGLRRRACSTGSASAVRELASCDCGAPARLVLEEALAGEGDRGHQHAAAPSSSATIDAEHRAPSRVRARGRAGLKRASQRSSGVRPIDDRRAASPTASITPSSGISSQRRAGRPGRARARASTPYSAEQRRQRDAASPSASRQPCR